MAFVDLEAQPDENQPPLLVGISGHFGQATPVVRREGRASIFRHEIPNGRKFGFENVTLPGGGGLLYRQQSSRVMILKLEYATPAASVQFPKVRVSFLGVSVHRQFQSQQQA